MNRQSWNRGLRFLIGTFMIFGFFAASGGTATAESAADYAAPFSILNQFDPANLTPDGNGNYLLSFQISGSVLGNTRVFIPTGAIKVNINFYAGVDAQVGMAARYNSPPQCDYTQISYPYWFCFPWDRDGGKLSGMSGRDMDFRNRGGHAFIVDDYFSTPLTQGGWLYLKVLDPDPKYSIHLFEYAVIVNGDAYRAWHALGSVPAPAGTVAGGCTFAAAPDCSPTTSTTPTTPTNTGGSGSFLDFFGVTPTSGGGSLSDLFGSLFGDVNLSPTHDAGDIPGSDMETRLDVEIDTTENGVGGEKVYRDADLANHSMVTLNASLKFEGVPSDEVDCFALIVANGGAAFINRETLFDGPSWLLFGGTDSIYRYAGENIAEKTVWVCNAFDFLNGLRLPPSFFTTNQLQFIYAIAPVGEVAMGKFENLRYAVISFRPDADSSLDTESPAAETPQAVEDSTGEEPQAPTETPPADETPAETSPAE